MPSTVRPSMCVRSASRRFDRAVLLRKLHRSRSVRCRGPHVCRRACAVGACVGSGVGETSEAVATAAVDAFVKLMVDDPAMGRVLLIAPLSEPVLSGRGIESMPAFVDLVYDQLSEIADPVDKQLVAVGLVGALFTLFIGYLDGTIVVDRDRFVRHCVRLLINANQA